jgi:hypothetical protein
VTQHGTARAAGAWSQKAEVGIAIANDIAAKDLIIERTEPAHWSKSTIMNEALCVSVSTCIMLLAYSVSGDIASCSPLLSYVKIGTFHERKAACSRTLKTRE